MISLRIPNLRLLTRRKGEKPGGGTLSWGDALLRPSVNKSSEQFQPSIPIHDVTGMTGSENIGVSPLDEYNIKLLDNVKPKNWTDPEPGDTKSMSLGR